jgi:formylglycine-generating enzyme required for sulfatase activity
MAGNVWEWIRDNYIEDWYAVSPNRNPLCQLEAYESSDHPIRGGSFRSTAEDLRASRRELPHTLEGDLASARIGFRCVGEAE